MVITSDGLDAQVVNETEDSTFNLDGITLYDTSDSNSGTVILVCKLMLLFLLI